FLPERRPAATGRIKTDWQLGNIQAAAPMPLTSPGNDDDTGENHQPTLRKNTAEPVEQTLKQNTNAVEAMLSILESTGGADRAGVTLLAARLAEGVAGIEYDDDRPDLSEYDIAFTADVGVQEGGR
ncbi:MAG: hypothetical protein Q3X83_10975, partial [Bifidobacterium sp.]|nr:hypothetical protein [Bifidobacterium sp.]